MTPGVRVLRVIARLNIGGPAIQAITLTRRLDDRGYATTLVRGSEDPHEGSMDDLAARVGVQPVLVQSLRRDPGRHDVRALVSLVRTIRRERPRLVHTHAAKAGTIGRVAALLSAPPWRRPRLVHTFHGHSLSGYFSPRTAAVYRAIERFLARRTDRLIAVSDEVRDELVALGVAPAEKFTVIPLGFELSQFALSDEARGMARDAIRAELGIPPDAFVVTLVARLVPIKRVDRFLAVAKRLAERTELTDIHFLIVGDGELREALLRSPEARRLEHRLTWAGFRRDMPDVYAASDAVALTSDNEGTPVSLIEAQAAGLPVVCTRVGGAASVVAHGKTGYVVDREATGAFADALRALHGDRELAGRLGRAGQARARARFDLDRLVDDIAGLYDTLLGVPAGRATVLAPVLSGAAR